MTKTLAVLGEFDPEFELHAATNAAILHSCANLRLTLHSEWISTEHASNSLFKRFGGIWVAPGSPYKNLPRTLEVIRYARENQIPCLGTCGGFQHMIIEYARNVMGFCDAQHAEYDPYSSSLFITRLQCSLFGQEMPLQFTPNSLVAACYGAEHATEKYYCNFGVAPEHVATIGGGTLRIVGRDSLGEIRAIELPNHPFYVGTLYVPQARSTPDKPHPLISAFLRVIAEAASAE